MQKGQPTTNTRPPKAGAKSSQTQEESRRETIAKAAYLRAEARGFSPGMELDDWLAAERDFVDKEFG